MRTANRAHHDVELSDWVTAIVLPASCHALLAVVTIAILVIGVFGAWELILWMVLSRAQTP
jgi:hypothetical protein